jgi:hypothetical protein
LCHAADSPQYFEAISADKPGEVGGGGDNKGAKMISILTDHTITNIQHTSQSSVTHYSKLLHNSQRHFKGSRTSIILNSLQQFNLKKKPSKPHIRRHYVSAYASLRQGPSYSPFGAILNHHRQYVPSKVITPTMALVPKRVCPCRSIIRCLIEILSTIRCCLMRINTLKCTQLTDSHEVVGNYKMSP